MDAVKRSYEMQAQVRHNADEFRNTLNELYNWEREIKEQEQDLERMTDKDEEHLQHLKTLPVRSHVVDGDKTTTDHQCAAMENSNDVDKKGEDTKTKVGTVEKSDSSHDPNENERKQANDIKDRGNKHVKLGEYEKAINEYSAAIALFAEDPIFYNNRALCYLKLEKYEECIEDCERAIEFDGLAVKAYYRRMQANECLGNNMDALKDCTTVLMIEPKNSEAKKSLERINEKLRQNAKSESGPNFSAHRDNMIDILPVDKPPYKRSNKPLRRVPITDVVGPKDSKNYDNANLKISDEDIDKLFNSNCGPFVEVKNSHNTENKNKTNSSKDAVTTTAAAPTATTVVENTASTTKVVLDDSKFTKPATVAQKLTSTSVKVAQKAAIATAAVTADLPAVDSNKLPTTKTTKIATPIKDETIILDANRPVPAAPISTAQFYSNWKELNAPQKYQYLKSIEIPNLCKVLGAGFDSDTLTDILFTLRNYYLPNKEPTLAAALFEVSKNNQTAILSLLMSTDERKVLSEILNSIKEMNSNTSVAELIAKNFNLH